MKPHYRVRKVKTSSGSTAIQVGFYKGKRFILEKHIGSSKDIHKIDELIGITNEYVNSNSAQLRFDFNPQSKEILFKRGIKVEKSILETASEYLENIYQQLGFNCLKNDVLKHFAIIRVLEPASKTKSIMLLNKYFNIEYKRTTVFRKLAKLPSLKEKVEHLAIKYAKNNLGFNFSLVFYDVTTLYFETHNEDDFRLNGFSKDNKINQPQILIGLVVNEIGFPICYDIFKGNTFEGKTILPVILGLKRKYHMDQITVIADAAMLSVENLTQLENHKIDYVVGARMGGLNLEEVRNIASMLGRTDKNIFKQESVIYEYSTKRARKDKIENNKQVNNPRLTSGVVH